MSTGASTNGLEEHYPILPVLRIAGVPEHFNYCWHLASQHKLFAQEQVQVEWHDVKQGTGALIQGLKQGDYDVIIALTEGIVSDIAQGSSLRIISTAVESRLCWGVFTGSKSDFQTIEDLRHTTIAVSRFTSGSHLMACVLATQRGWKQDDLKFIVKGTIDKLRDSVNDGSASAFLWEKMMCKPDVDAGVLKCIGEILTPWSSFVIVALKETLDVKLEAIQRALIAVRKACLIFANDSSVPQSLADRFNFKLDDITKWLSTVKVTCSSTVNESNIDTALSALQEAGILSASIVESQFPLRMIDTRIASLNSDIRSMKLYSRPELLRATYQILQANKLDKGSCSYSQLLPFTLNCYEPLRALEQLSTLVETFDVKKAINIGSNLGSLARYLAGKHAVEVVAVELQPELNTAAAELTARTKGSLHAQVIHLCADATTLLPLLAPSFDLIYSFLTMLHFDPPARTRVFQQSARLLSCNGRLLIADWIAVNPLTDEEKLILSRQVFCRYLASREEYLEQLVAAGLLIDSVEDVSERWRLFTETRVKKWQAEKDDKIALHSEDLYKRLEQFYLTSHQLMSGNVGGIIIICKSSLQPTSVSS